MGVIEKAAEELYQAYQSGKNGVALECAYQQEGEEVFEYLRNTFFPDSVVLELENGVREYKKIDYYAPCFKVRPRNGAKKESTLYYFGDIENCQPNQYAAIGTEKAIARGVHILLINRWQLLESGTRESLMRVLLQILGKRKEKQLPMILITVDKRKNIPQELSMYLHVVSVEKPDVSELQEKVQENLQKLAEEQKISGEMLSRVSFQNEIVSYLQGFRCFEISYLFRLALERYKADAFDPEKKRILELISEQKVQMLEREGLLEWKLVKHVDLANMDILLKHLTDSGKIMGHLEEAVREGAEAPKGILVMGLPGTGKSLFAQYAAAKLKLPLVRLEMGRMMGGVVGESERNLRMAQKQAEELAPCILWIDEIEKGFAGSDRDANEGAYLKRMTGGFLTWLQEKKSSCYVIATANSIDGIPKEMLRKGRFDECFYTSMPSEQEVREILKVHLSKPERAHVMPVAEEAIGAVMRLAIANTEKRFFTGADANALVVNTFNRLYLDYHDSVREETKKEYDCKHLREVMEAEFAESKLFSQTYGENIGRYYQEIKKLNFVPVSKKSPDTHYNLELKEFIAGEIKKLKS